MSRTVITLTVGTGKRLVDVGLLDGGLDVMYQMDPSVWSKVWASAGPDTTVLTSVSGWFTPLNAFWKADFREVGDLVAPTIIPLQWVLEVVLPDGEVLTLSRTEALFSDLEDCND